MLELAAERTAGSHPYLVTPEHTAMARKVMGDGPLLAPEQKVILEPDAATARALAGACSPSTSASPTTSTTCIGWGSRTTIWRTAARTSSSMP